MPPTLVMLHGAIGSGESLQVLASALSPHACIETPNLLGHGGRPVPASLSVQALADDVISYMDERQIARAFMFGYSFGGYTALYLARHHPDRVRGICLLAVKYVFDVKTVRHFSYLADPDRLRRPGSEYPTALARRHYPQDWVAITMLNKNLFLELGTNPALSEQDLRSINVPTLIISADQDQLVPWAETLALSQLIPASRLEVFAGQAHPLLACPIQDIAEIMGKWLGECTQAEPEA